MGKACGGGGSGDARVMVMWGRCLIEYDGDVKCRKRLCEGVHERVQ